MYGWTVGDTLPLVGDVDGWVKWAWSDLMMAGVRERQAALSLWLTRPGAPEEEMTDLAAMVTAAGIRWWHTTKRPRSNGTGWGWDGEVRAGMPWWNGRRLEWHDRADWMHLWAAAYWGNPIVAEQGRKVHSFACIVAAARIPRWSVDPMMPESTVLSHAEQVWFHSRTEALDRTVRGLLVPLIESGIARNLARPEVEAAAEGEMVAALARHFAGNAEGRWLCRVCAEDGGRWLLIAANRARLPVLWLGVADQQ